MTLPPFALSADQAGTLPAALPLYPTATGTPDGQDAPDEVVESRGEAYLDRFIARVCRPTLTPYLPPTGRATGAGVMICPGGAYRGVAIDKEGHDIARWLNSFGMAGFVLKYRSPSPDRGPQCRPDGPWRDAQAGLRLIRAHAADWGLRPGAIGVMGFSAGAHLAATVSTLTALDGAASEAPCPRPDFTVLLYPVISMTVPGLCHEGSCANLLGQGASADLRQRFSCECQVNPETPPAFLAQTQDDAVPVANSLVYYQALARSGVPAEMHLYPEGGHGYGLRRRGLGIDAWPEHCREWLLRRLA